ALVNEGLVSGWDDPRMPTICGYRRRGYTPEAIRMFVDRIGYTLYDALNDMALMESAVREDLNKKATRVAAVVNPVKLVITNYPEGKTEELDAVNNPEDPEAGSHKITFSRELWIEREDFMEDAPKKYFRLTPGNEVRLKNAYIVTCIGCKKDTEGNVEEVYAEYIPQTKTGEAESNRKVKGTIHWVSTSHAIKAEVRMYDRLWKIENPRDELARLQKEENMTPVEAMKKMINENSLEVRPCCYVESYLAETKPLDHFQFQRIGYFCTDKDSTPEHLVFNRTVSLKDTWAKMQK
ncbi:MAG TPA: glutamine--tRNA ligase, partial [Prevotellaceae bacterium]|nr:glutamine--tRNA ligase [Prevotellaceae bacterium]